MKRNTRWLISAGFALSLLFTSAANAWVVIRVAPPAPRHEVIITRPGPNHVWVPGYWRWSGREYGWVGGVWQLPPRPHAVWVPGHYRRVRGGHVWVEGRWR
jgi:hypothetical protein